MIDVTMENFEADVIAASQTTPVLVDFWADWCAPCKSLGPVLEKLEADYAGRFRLVKINADTEQQLAGAFGVKSLPPCILLMGGRPVDGFMGAIPEGKVREFLDKHLPSDGEVAAQADAQEAEQLLQAGDAHAALAKLSEVKVFDDEAAWSAAAQAAPVAVIGELRVCLFIEVDVAAEKIRLGKEVDRLQNEITKAGAKLSNEAFVAKAPPAVIEEAKKRVAEFTATLTKVQEQLVKLQK